MAEQDSPKKSKDAVSGASKGETAMQSLDQQPDDALATSNRRPTAKKLYKTYQDGEMVWSEQIPDETTEADCNDSAIVLRYAKSATKHGDVRMRLHSITIQNNKLRQVVQAVLAKYPGLDTNVQELTFQSSFVPFVHRWGLLEERRKACEDEEELAIIDLLYDPLRELLHEDIEQAAELSANGNTTYKGLLLLFPPGKLVFSKSHGQDTCWVVSKGLYRTDPSGKKFFLLTLWNLDHDGTGYGWSRSSVTLPEFEGLMRIEEMEVVPREYRPDSASLTTHLASRGTKAMEILRTSYLTHHGLITIRKGWGSLEQYVEGRIMLDTLQFARHNPNALATASPYPPGLHNLVSEAALKVNVNRPAFVNDGGTLLDGHTMQPESKRAMGRASGHRGDASSLPGVQTARESKADDLLRSQRWTKVVFGVDPEVLCSPVVRGYCLQSKVWAEFSIENISEVVWNDDAFDRLVMPEQRKRLLGAMVEQQKKHKAELDDVVRGKGQGLILLLEGPPGTGKTLTAESIADRLRMPLYAISASELGDDSKDLEEELGRVLRLAAAWNAVLLLDEADAFLEKRGDGPGSLERNKRVAAFLRVLEYYKGVLILTTNRGLDFDEAFYSRIHLSLKYPDLDSAARGKVWSNFVLPVTDKIAKADLEALASEDLNGRQIKNVVKMARLLAENERSKLSVEHIHDVMSVVQEDIL